MRIVTMNEIALINWLSSVDVSTNHQAARKLHETGTGDWFLKSDDFAWWQREAGSVLWLPWYS